MNKSPIFIVLATLALAIAGCAGDPPQQTSSNAPAAPSDSSGVDGHWMVPISFPN